MAPLPTKSRIFADRYRRDLKQREAHLAGKITAGAKTWTEAMHVFSESVMDAGSPIKRADMILKLTNFLNDSIEEGAHFLLDCGKGKRTGGVIFATLSAGENPLLGVDEEGVCIAKHHVLSRRNGLISAISGTDIAFVSKHAIGRLHERGHDLSNSKATCVLACVGILGLLTRNSSKHVDGGLSMVYDDTLIVGSLKHAVRDIGKHEINGTFFDVRTALHTDQVIRPEMIDQGVRATNAVAAWLDDRTISRSHNTKLAEAIPFLPARDDYSFQHAVIDQRSKQP